MVNAYANLAQIKEAGWLGITHTDYDAVLLRILNDISRDIDQLTNTYFYCYEGIRYFDGSANPFLPDDDILNITTLAVDEDGNGTYERTMATTDYVMYPANKYPKRMFRTTLPSAFSGFATNIRFGVKITGVFGYADVPTPYSDSGVVVNSGGISAGATTHALATGLGVSFSPGMTIRIDNEQLYISAVNGDTLTFEANPDRGQNGTVAASHLAGAKIYIYYYYGPVVEATLIQATKIWKRRESAFATSIGDPATGIIHVYKGLDSDVAQMLRKAIRRTF